jgi:hypothetical protein
MCDQLCNHFTHQVAATAVATVLIYRNYEQQYNTHSLLQLLHHLAVARLAVTGLTAVPAAWPALLQQLPVHCRRHCSMAPARRAANQQM